MNKVKGLCVLDVDGTLIEEEVIDLLGKEAGCEKEVAQITAQAMRGELDFESSLKKRVSLLKGLSIDALIRFIMNFPLVKMLCSLLKLSKKVRLKLVWFQVDLLQLLKD